MNAICRRSLTLQNSPAFCTQRSNHLCISVRSGADNRSNSFRCSGMISTPTTSLRGRFTVVETAPIRYFTPSPLVLTSYLHSASTAAPTASGTVIRVAASGPAFIFPRSGRLLPTRVPFTPSSMVQLTKPSDTRYCCSGLVPIAPRRTLRGNIRTQGAASCDTSTRHLSKRSNLHLTIRQTL
jgi:hypothetical protein